MASDISSLPSWGPAQPRHSQVDFVVETGDALMCPVFPQLGQNVAQSVRPRPTESIPGYLETVPCGPPAQWVWPSGPPPPPPNSLLGGRAPLSLAPSPSTEGGESPGPPSPRLTPPHLVMVPSMSEMTTLSSHFHR